MNPQAQFHKALAEDKLDCLKEAAGSYHQFIDMATPEYVEQLNYFQKRLNQLEDKPRKNNS